MDRQIGWNVTYFEEEMFPFVHRVRYLGCLLTKNETAHCLHLVMIEFFVIYCIIFFDWYTYISNTIDKIDKIREFVYVSLKGICMVCRLVGLPNSRNRCSGSAYVNQSLLSLTSVASCIR